MTGRPKDPKTARNKNVLVIGGSGSGKTRFYVKPNLMQCFPTSDYPTSFVVTDPKGTLILETGQMFQRAGYRVKILNTINFSKSMKYNPFVYIHSEKDVLKLVNTLIANTKGEGEKSAEDFWVKSERLFYTALIGYIWYEAPAEEMNFTTLLEMINASEAREDDPDFQSPVDLMFERLEQKDPDHFAVRQYKKFLLSAGKTRSSILISCGARLAPFDIREVRELMEDDEMELDTIGDEKTVLFLIMSDTDTTFNFILAMLQSQLINLLCDRADDKYDADKKALDGGQLDAPGLTLPDAGQEALNLLGQTAAVSEVLLGDKLAAFREAAEKANEIPAPVKIPDPAAEPTVTILWSESDKLQDGEIMPLSVANRVFEELDTAQHTDREKDGYTGGWYDKTAFRIDFTLNGQPDNYEGRQDFGDGDGSLIQHIQSYHEYYAKDENWKNFVLHNKGPEAWEQDKAEREMVLTEFIPYLKQHCNLSAMEQTATTALQEGQNASPEQTAYYNAIISYVQDCRPLLNQGQYDLPEPPKLADFDQTLQDYKAQVQAEIEQEAAAAGMTVEEYAAAGFESPQQGSFSIYQLRNEDSTRDYRFKPYDRLQAAGRTVDKANYMEVYAAPLTAGTTLEDIYRTFNIDHPADFKGHSLSVSDVVVLHQNGQDTAHYCDSAGFQQVPEFLRENPLRTAELSTEQNENMIDGVLNNAPSLGELEAKAKAGEQISLTDLAAAVKAEEKAPKAKKSRAAKPKKPSIRAQLDAAKKEQSKQTPPREKTKELEV